MRVLLASPSMGVGGAERVTAMLASGLVEHGVEVALAAPRGVRDEDLSGVPVERYVVGESGRAVAKMPRIVLQLAKVLRIARPDVVHAQNPRFAATMRFAMTVSLKGHRVPLLATYHGVASADRKRAVRVLRLADHIVCVSEAALGELLGCGLDRARASVIYNGVEVRPEPDEGTRRLLEVELETGGNPIVAIVGRLVPQKAHERFIVAARHVADQRDDVRFVVVGDGPRRTEIEALADRAGLGNVIRFTGFRSDARAIIACAKILAFSSDWEGLSIAALEALACGTPVISTDVAGMRELIGDSDCGRIVPRDDGRSLGESILELLADEPARALLGRQGREAVASRFSTDRMVQGYLSRYEALLSGL